MTFSVWMLLIMRKKIHDYIETEYHFRSRSTAIDAPKNNKARLFKPGYVTQFAQIPRTKDYHSRYIIDRGDARKAQRLSQRWAQGRALARDWGKLGGVGVCFQANVHLA